MAAVSRLKYVYLSYFSRPTAPRWLYRTICRNKISRIVQLGLGSVERAVRVIEVAQRFAPAGRVYYTAVDLFEARELARERFALKEAYRCLQTTGARIRLVPGSPKGGLGRVANQLGGTQLLIIGPEHTDACLSEAWFYLPRMLTSEAIVVRETWSIGNESTLQQRLSLEKVRFLAERARLMRAA